MKIKLNVSITFYDLSEPYKTKWRTQRTMINRKETIFMASPSDIGGAVVEKKYALQVTCDTRGRIVWANLNQRRRIEMIERDMQEFMDAGNKLSLKSLRDAGMFSEIKAIQKYYPGSLTGLQQKLSPHLVKQKRSKGYWIPERVREEVQKLYDIEGEVSYTSFLKRGRKDVCRAIDRYPGGFSQLVVDAGLRTSSLEKKLRITDSGLQKKRARVRWKIPGNTDEDNEELGIRNIQAYFLEKFHEFNERFPRGEDGKIAENRRGQARDYILERTRRKFRAIFEICPKKKAAPYFGGSRYVMLQKSFEPWGVEFEGQKPPEGWFTVNALTQDFKRGHNVVPKIAEKFRMGHPEWFCKYLDSKERLREHYSPELIEEIIHILKERGFGIKEVAKSISPDEAWEDLQKFLEVPNEGI